MTTRTFNFLNIDVSVPVPENSAEYNELAKRKNADGTLKDAALEDATTFTVYHKWASTYRSVFLHGRDADAKNNVPEVKGVEELSGIERNVEKNDKGEFVKYSESEANYFKRVLAKEGKEASAYQDLANLVCGLVDFDPAAREGAGAPKKTGKQYLEAADSIIAKGADVAAQVCAALAKVLGLTSVEPTREALGKAISQNEAKKRAEKEKSLAADYVGLIQA